MEKEAINSKSIDQMLKYQLSADPSYVAGKSVIIGFTLQNTSDENLWILKWYTPLEGIEGKIFKVTCDGKEIPYEGRMIKRGDPSRDDYIFLAPKDSVFAEVDLSKAYSLPVCNECLVTFKGKIHDIVIDESRLPNKSENHQGAEIPGNTISFRLVSS
jgi:hypothetical protein